MECARCGTAFKPRRKGQVYCERACQKAATNHTARAHERAHGSTQFIGVDGEGFTDSIGVHHYTMISVGNATLASETHLDFREIMAFLWKQFEKNPTASFVGFFLGYDFSQWLRTLPEGRARMLMVPEAIATRKRHGSGGNPIPFPVRYEGWEFDILGMKRFKLRKQGAKHWMYVCDTGAFFQQALLGVIDPKNWPDGPICTDEEFAIILEGKQHRADEYTRATWKAALPKLTEYNVLENEILARVMVRYESGLRAVGIELKRDQWYGPGAAANAFLNMVGTVTGEDLRQQVAPEVLDFARQSYYGGWFEVMAHGIVPGTSWEADVTSAYPHAMSVMPSWADCDYEWTETMPDFGLVDCTVQGSDPVVGAMLHRQADGTILRPHLTRGIYWSFEIEAAQRAGLIDTIEVHRAVAIYWDHSNYQPLMDTIPTLFKQRQEVGKTTPQGKAIKLVLNSLYGKSAQSIGSPKHANQLAASFITAHCRTAILDAIAKQGGTENLLMVATDGVYFTERPVGLEEGSFLGQWEVAPKERLTIVMPGVHYHDGSRAAAKKGDLSKLRTRGISAAGFAASIEVLDAGFERLLQDPGYTPYWPTLSVPIKFKVHSPKLALHQGNWAKAGTVERDIERNLDSNPKSKRNPPVGGVFAGAFDQDAPYLDPRGFVRSRPYARAKLIGSTPYDKFFGGTPLSDDPLKAVGDSPDGPLVTQLNMLLDGE